MTRSVGGCDSAEDPRLDARDANPLWAIDTDDLLHVRAARRQPQPPDKRFSLWRVIGRKSLTLFSDNYLERLTTTIVSG